MYPIELDHACMSKTRVGGWPRPPRPRNPATPQPRLPLVNLQRSAVILIISVRHHLSLTDINYSNRTPIPHTNMGTNQNKPKSLSRFFLSASDSNLVNDPPAGSIAASGSDSQSEQSCQATLSPPTISRRRRILHRLGWESPLLSPLPSPLPSPSSSGVALHNTGAGHHHITTSESSSVDYAPPSCPGVQGVPFASVTSPVGITVSAPVSVPVSEPVSEPVSAQISPQLTISPAKTDTPKAADPHTIEPQPHSSVVWTKALDIAQNKLSENNLPQLDTTKLTSESAGENIDAVVKSLNVLQQDGQKNRWRYTWRGKEIIIAERLGKILRSIEKYSTAVGTAIQCGPPVSAIVWAGIQGIMRVCI